MFGVWFLHCVCYGLPVLWLLFKAFRVHARFQQTGYISAGADTQLMSQPVAVSANARFDASARHVLSLPAGVGLAETLGQLSDTWDLAFQVGTRSC